jgi:hypothetical protein
MQPGNSHRHSQPHDQRQDPRHGQRRGPQSPLDPLLLTPRLSQQAAVWLGQLETCEGWHGSLPVLLLERCWLRLTAIPVEHLAGQLPPDPSWDAPELVRYRQLLEQGLPPLSAEQLCWSEFGAEACHQAQRRLWHSHERGNQGWTLQRYLELLRLYRLQLEQASGRQLPLLVLARPSEATQGTVHELVWLGRGSGDRIQPMRHTCA